MTRLRRSDCSGEGIARRRAGRGFVYLDSSGERIADGRLERIKGLAVPPAWTDVWICPHVNGHVQATGFDEAGRKQYLYHEEWTRRRATAKFDAMLEFASRLPRLRRAVADDLDPDDAAKPSVVACAVRLIDLAYFRVGGEEYAEENGTFGIATVRRDQVSLPKGEPVVRFRYPAKGSKRRRLTVRDGDVRGLAERLKRRRTGPDDFLVYREAGRWADLRSADVNEYIQGHLGDRFSAKDFRTWHGTVLAAVALARAGAPPASRRARERRIRDAVELVADSLGNTAAVARESYVDPKLLDLYRDGEVIRMPAGHRRARRGLSKVEREVLSLISD